MPSPKPRKTKLIATIGPACDSIETLKAMIRAGLDVARLNFSHGSHEEHRKRLEAIRQASAETGANVPRGAPRSASIPAAKGKRPRCQQSGFRDGCGR